MINRVFCYSKEAADKHLNKLSKIPLFIFILISWIFIIACFYIMIALNFNEKTYMIATLILVIIWLIILLYYLIPKCNSMTNKNIAYATDTQGRVYKVMNIGYGQGLHLAGTSTGSIVDHLAGSNSNVGQSLGGAVGVAVQFRNMNKSAEYMSQPEVVAKIIEEAANIKDVLVFVILKVHSITDKGKSIKINCDFKAITTNKIRYRKNFTIEKSYNMFEDLMSALNALK